MQLGDESMSRIASRAGEKFARSLNFILLTLPGTPINYYGEELGALDLVCIPHPYIDAMSVPFKQSIIPEPNVTLYKILFAGSVKCFLALTNTALMCILEISLDYVFLLLINSLNRIDEESELNVFIFMIKKGNELFVKVRNGKISSWFCVLINLFADHITFQSSLNKRLIMSSTFGHHQSSFMF